MLKSITIHDITRLLKISTSTVSRALNESCLISPSLSTVDQQTEEMCKTAADLLIKMINSGKTDTSNKNQHIILEPLLKKREPTAINLSL
jgi:DNA-binding LacI/PurR family transcriptional regulator